VLSAGHRRSEGQARRVRPRPDEINSPHGPSPLLITCLAQATYLLCSLLSNISVFNCYDAAQVKGDVRLIKSKQFATDYSLRFPRVARVRFDSGDHKAPQETMTQEALLEEVAQRRASGARDINDA